MTVTLPLRDGLTGTGPEPQKSFRRQHFSRVSEKKTTSLTITYAKNMTFHTQIGGTPSAAANCLGPGLEYLSR